MKAGRLLKGMVMSMKKGKKKGLRIFAGFLAVLLAAMTLWMR